MKDIELLTEIYAWLCFNTEPTKEEIAKLKNSIKEHIKNQLPPHIHQAGKTNVDECNLCGHNIRHQIHINP